ncbi:MAG: ATP synthase F1 subunit gamma [Lachnospiraceae bacterium]|nr:ATP synthase F1 subunit gamma [Lachnospiraceae bacterium]
MATTKEIKDRISSVKNTQKITNAMYLISSTKMRKAKEELDRTRPYFELQRKEIKRIFRNAEEVDSPYFYPETGRKEGESYAYLVITADKGLAGSYNYNVLHEAERVLEKHKKVKLFVVGEYGRHYFMKHDIPITQSFLYTAQNPTFHRAREICERLLSEYLNGEVDEIRIIYSDMKNELLCDVKTHRLLPLERGQFETKKEEIEKMSESEVRKEKNYEFYPSVNKVLDSIIRSYLSGFIYGGLVDSFSAEQNARMNAMSSANKNAEELLGDLSIEYNRVRQAAITQEITEVAAGAKAQKQRRAREEASRP